MIFDVVKRVLRDFDDAGLEEHADAWDDLVQENLESLEAGYRVLRDPNRDLIDYSTLEAQTAYLFRYVIGHAELIAEILRRVRQGLGQRLFKKGTLRVASMGGGPGSELLGLLKYLNEIAADEGVTRIEYTVFDKEPAWQHPAEALALAASEECGIEVELVFEEMDVTDADPGNAPDLSDFDLVFMSFFISEICALPQGAAVQVFVREAMATMASGSHLLYNDSNAYSFYTYMNGRARAARRFDQIVEIQDNIEVQAREMGGILDSFEERFDYRPKLSGNLVAKFFRRA